MTKKDYDITATALHEALKHAGTRTDGVYYAVKFLVEAFKAQNDAFDSEKFMAAISTCKGGK